MLLALTNIATGFEQNPLVVRIVGALLILFVGFIAGRLLGLLLRRILHEIGLDTRVRKSLGFRLSLEQLLGSTLSIILYAAAIIIMLVHLNMFRIVAIILAALVVVIVVLSLFLAMKDFLPNFFAGLSILYKKRFSQGDIITIRSIKGEIKRVNLLSTIVKQGEDKLFIPNRLFLKEKYKVSKKKIIR